MDYENVSGAHSIEPMTLVHKTSCGISQRPTLLICVDKKLYWEESGTTKFRFAPVVLIQQPFLSTKVSGAIEWAPAKFHNSQDQTPSTLLHNICCGIKTTGTNREFLVSFSF